MPQAAWPGPLQPVPEWLEEAARRALHDMQQPSAVELTLGLSQDGEFLFVLESSDGGAGFWLGRQNPGEELVVEFADFLQDQVFDQLEEAWGEARPACPGHPHPASAVHLDGIAQWVCPYSNQPLGRIGELYPAPA